MGSSSPKIYLIDIETSPNIGYTWGKYDQNVIAYQKEWELLSFAWKPLGSARTDCLARCDFDSEAALIAAVWAILDGADVLIGHNIDQFDNRKLRAKFVQHRLPPPTPYKTIDTKKIAKACFAFNSNSLNDLAATLQLGKKAATGGFDLWLQCMAGDPKAWKKMIAYNKQDVVLLEKVYNRLKTWYPSHPNLALYDEDAQRPACPVCRSAKVQRRGKHVMRVRTTQRYQCRSCAHWFQHA